MRLRSKRLGRVWTKGSRACGVWCLAVSGVLAAGSVAAASDPGPLRSEIESHVRFLTSPLLEGRRAGTLGADLAAHYVEARFRAAGLAPAVGSGDTMSFLQPFCVATIRCDTVRSRFAWERSGQRDSLRIGSLVTCVPGGSRSIEVEAPVVFCGYGLDVPDYGFSQLPPALIDGRVVVAVHGQPRTETLPDLREASPSAKLAAAAASGARAVVIVPDPRGSPAALARWRAARGLGEGGSLERLRSSSQMPALFLLEAAARDSLLGAFLSTAVELLDSIDAGGGFAPLELSGLTIDFAAVPAKLDTFTTCNVVGSLGDSPAAILVGAHYDHLGIRGGELHPGADDNASGLAVLLESARLLGGRSQANVRLLFVAFGAEECGQLGSLFYCEHSVVPCAATSLMICLDSVGREGSDHYRHLGDASGQPPGKVYVYRSEPHRMLDALVEAHAPRSSLTFEASRSPLLRWGSDHWRFENAGVPVLFYFSGVHRDYHRPTDTWDKIDMVKLQELAQHLCHVLESFFE